VEENRRAFVEKLAEELDIKMAEDWQKVEKQHVKEHGGSGILRHFTDHPLGSVFGMLLDAYPELTEADVFRYRRRLPKGFTADLENRRTVLGQLAEGLGVKEAKDWAQVSTQRFQGAGGTTLLQFYDGSMSRLLADLVGEEAAAEGRRSHPQGHWAKVENRREFVGRLEEKFCIVEPRDWRRVKNEDVKQEAGGSSLLAKYNGSFWALLQDTLPESKEWSEEQCRATVSKGYWDSLERRRAFFGRLAEKKGVRTAKDWASVTTADILEEGGGGLLGRYGNIHLALADIYGEGKDWDVRLCRPSVPGSYWDDDKNVAAFLYEVQKKLSIKSKEDWYRVSRRQLLEHKASGLLSKMTLCQALAIAFPNERWNEDELRIASKRSTQRALFRNIHSIFVEPRMAAM